MLLTSLTIGVKGKSIWAKDGPEYILSVGQGAIVNVLDFRKIDTFC